MSGIGRASVLIGAGTIVSRLTGFLRAVVRRSAAEAGGEERPSVQQQTGVGGFEGGATKTEAYFQTSPTGGGRTR